MSLVGEGNFPLLEERLTHLTIDVARNRFFLAEKYDPFAKEKDGEQKVIYTRRSKWVVEASVWAPRKKTSNSRDYFETNAALHRMFDVDWEFARQAHGLEKLIQRTNPDLYDNEVRKVKEVRQQIIVWRRCGRIL